MTDDPRQALVEVVRQYGGALADDPRRTEALLRDYCPERKRETFQLVSAIRERVPADLLTSKDSTPRDVLLPRLMARLSENLGLPEAAARWAVESWALALGVVSAAEMTAPPPPPAPVAPSYAPAAPPGFPPATAPAMPVLEVAQTSSARYQTIGAALQDAWPGQRVVVRAGVYRESLVLGRPVELVAESASAEVTLESTGAPCLVLQTETALVRGFSLVQRAAPGQPGWAIDVLGGKPVIEDCRITIDATAHWSAAIFIHGQLADPTIRRCTVSDTPCSALLASERARGTLEDCQFSRNGGVGMPAVVGITGAQTALIRSRIEGAGAAAIWCGDGGALRLDGCDIERPAGSAVEVAGGAPVVRRSRFRGPHGAGIAVTGGGRGQFEDCEIADTSGPGISVGGGGAPVFRRCSVRDSGGDGMLITDNAFGTFEDCQVHSPAQAGLQVARGGNPRLRRCRLVGARAHAGALLWAGAQAGLEECEITANAGSGVELRQGASALIRRCTIHANGAYAVILAEASSATVERSTLRPNPHGAWYVQPGCQLRQSANIE